MLILILVSLSPFVLNAVMAVNKWLSDLQDQGNKGSKRFFLALLSLVGVIAFSASQEIRGPKFHVNLFETMVESFVAFLVVHGTYTLFWNRPKAMTQPAE